MSSATRDTDALLQWFCMIYRCGHIRLHICWSCGFAVVDHHLMCPLTELWCFTKVRCYYAALAGCCGSSRPSTSNLGNRPRSLKQHLVRCGGAQWCYVSKMRPTEAAVHTSLNLSCAVPVLQPFFQDQSSPAAARFECQKLHETAMPFLFVLIGAPDLLQVHWFKSCA